MSKHNRYPSGVFRTGAAIACGAIMLVGCSAKSESADNSSVKPDCKVTSKELTAIQGSGYDLNKLAIGLGVDADQVSANGIIGAVKCDKPIAVNDIQQGKTKRLLVEGLTTNEDELVQCLAIGFATDQPPQGQTFEDDVLVACA